MDYYYFLGAVFFLSLFVGILLCLYFGHMYAVRQEARLAGKQQGGVKISEGAIFALLGLLMAFTFSGALTKFNDKRFLVIEEANALNVAYSRFALLPIAKQILLKNKLNKYLKLRIKTYKLIPDFVAVGHALTESAYLQHEIWKDAVQACELVKKNYGCSLVLPALNTAFSLGRTRVMSARIHPPLIIFGMLIGMVLISGVFVGYKIPRNKKASVVHVVCYALMMSFIVWLIIDIEYPRIGFVQIDKFDKVLHTLKIDLKRQDVV